MPWLSIIIAIVSFFLSKASGLSTGASLAIAAGAGVGTYLPPMTRPGAKLIWRSSTVGQRHRVPVQLYRQAAARQLDHSTQQSVVWLRPSTRWVSRLVACSHRGAVPVLLP